MVFKEFNQLRYTPSFEVQPSRYILRQAVHNSGKCPCCKVYNCSTPSPLGPHTEGLLCKPKIRKMEIQQ